MNGTRRTVRRRILARRFAAAFALLFVLPVSASWAFADDAAGSSREDVLSLQRRLTDAGCYNGAIDGEANAALDQAIKACPDQSPFLRIETGMHTAIIRKIGVDAACRLIATAADDKTVRLWSIPSGRLERTIRLPIGPGNEGRVLAALSPDGRRLAAGGRDASYAKLGYHSLSFFDLDSGSIRRVGTFTDRIVSVSFSPDGARVALGLHGKNGIRVYDWSSSKELLADRDYENSVEGLTFAPDGSLIASSDDGQLHRYGSDLRLTAKRSVAGPKAPPYGVAIDRAGQRLAVGFHLSPKVSIFDAASLAPIADADVGGLTDGDLSNVAWSPDGGTLIAGGSAEIQSNGAWRRLLRSFDPKGRRRGPDLPISSNTVVDLRPCGEGTAFAAADPAFGLASPGRSTKVLQGPRTANMVDKIGKGLEISGDGAVVRFGLGYIDEKPVAFDVGAISLSESPRAAAGLAPARVDGLPVTDWQNNLTPKFKGVKIALEEFESSLSLAIRPGRSGFAIGTDWYVRAFDTTGNPLWKQPTQAEAWGVNFSADGRILVIACADGTIRWLRGSDGQELLAFFVDVPTRRWVAWTPTGYYMASPGGEDLIGWHLNRGWTQEADFFPASRFSARFNRPDIVQLVLKTLDEAAAIMQANDKAKRRAETASLETTLPPVVTIVSPTTDGAFTGNSVNVSFTVRSPSGLTIDRVDALIDGRPVEARGVEPAASQAAAPSNDARHLTIPAPPHDFELALIARSGALVGEAAKVRLVYSGAPPVDPAAVLKPKLYAVTIGVSAYAEPDLRLGYAAADARAFAELLQKQKGGLYGDVQVKTLVDSAATRAGVVEALEWLEQQVTSRDLGAVLIAGHGVTDEKQRYWFLPADASMQHLRTSAVSQDDIQSTMGALAGKAILFLDTCHANAAVAGVIVKRSPVDVNTLVNEFSKTENGVVTFASSQGRETSEESAAWGHGAFTEALIEGLGEGKANLLHNGSITVSELDAYIAERVKVLTEGRQHPVMSRPNTIPDFAFALAK